MDPVARAESPPERAPTPLTPRWLSRATLGVLLAGALLLRAWGIQFGLPHLYYWDEPSIVSKSVQFGTGDLDPHFYMYPALFMYVVFGVIGAYFVGARLTGHFHSAQDLAVEYLLDPSNVYLAARATTAVLGTATVALTYLLGSRLWGKRVGLLGALFLAVAFIHTSNSHVAIADIPQGFLIVAACLPLLQVLRRGLLRDYALAGALIGLGMATKYLAGMLLLSLVVAHCLGPRVRDRSMNLSSRWAPLLLGFAAALGGFFAGSPFTLLNFREFLAAFATQKQMSEGGSGSSIGYLLFRLIPADFGWPLAVAALLGLVVLLGRVLRTRDREALLLLVFPTVYLAFVARYPSIFPRYLVPVEPFLALLAAVAVEAGFSALARRAGSRVALGALSVTCAVLVFLPLRNDLRWDRMLSAEVDTRTQALRWAEANIPGGTPVALHKFAGQVYFNAPLVTDAAVTRLAEKMNGGKARDLQQRVLSRRQSGTVFKEVELVQDVQALAAAGVKYVFESEQNPPFEPGFRAALEASSRSVLRFQSPRAAGLAPATRQAAPVLPPTITVYALR
jgi:hypothetical protein